VGESDRTIDTGAKLQRILFDHRHCWSTPRGVLELIRGGNYTLAAEGRGLQPELVHNLAILDGDSPLHSHRLISMGTCTDKEWLASLNVRSSYAGVRSQQNTV
jgi:hypothetical protein